VVLSPLAPISKHPLGGAYSLLKEIIVRSFLKVRRLVTFIILILLLAIFLTSTNPANLPVGVLMVPILLVFFAGFVGTLLACDLFKIFPSHTKKKRSLAATIATMFAIGLVLGSSGAIVLSDIVLIFLILMVALIYISNF
jgi:hypothetical protein